MYFSSINRSGRCLLPPSLSLSSLGCLVCLSGTVCVFCVQAPATTAAPKAAAPSYESAGAGAGRETRTVTAPPAGGKLIHPEEDVSLVGAVHVSWLQSWIVPVKSYSITY